MSRFLFVFPPLVGHVQPASGVAQELRDRGHEVAWVVHEAAVGDLIGKDADVYPAGDEFLEDIVHVLPEHDRLRGVASLRFLWEEFLVPLAVSMFEPVQAAVEEFQPHVIVSDQQALAGGMIAADRGLPWAVSACSTAELLEPLSAMPKVAAWVLRQIEGLHRRLGLPHLAEAGFDPRFSAPLVIEYSTLALVGEVDRDLSSVAFVGPVLPPTGDPRDFPWDWLGRHERNVLVSLGTVTHDRGVGFLERVMEAVSGQPYGVVLVGQAEALPAPPANVLIRPFVPQLDLLPLLHAVVCHAGHNTTVGALMHGIPLVCAPIREDQPVTASQVVKAGAGRRISFARARAGEIRGAIDAVLHDPSYRAAAGQVAESFRVAGGATAAAGHLEALVPHRSLISPRNGVQ